MCRLNVSKGETTNKRLKAFLDDENIFQGLVESGILPPALARLFWDVKVVETKSLLRKNVNARRITATIPTYQRIELIEGSSIRLGVGKPSGPGVLQMQLVQYNQAAKPKGSSWGCDLQGDLSLILPEIGLIPVPTRHSLTQLIESRLAFELAQNLFQPKQKANPKLQDAGSEFQLHGSVLRFGPGKK